MRQLVTSVSYLPPCDPPPRYSMHPGWPQHVDCTPGASSPDGPDPQLADTRATDWSYWGFSAIVAPVMSRGAGRPQRAWKWRFEPRIAPVRKRLNFLWALISHLAAINQFDARFIRISDISPASKNPQLILRCIANKLWLFYGPWGGDDFSHDQGTVTCFRC